MKKIITISLLALMAGFIHVDAQITVAEPDFVNQYLVLTSDSTADQLPKEMAKLSHQEKTKTGKWISKIKKGASVVANSGIATGLLGARSGSWGAASKGFEIASKGMAVGDAAEAVSGLTGGGEAMYFTFEGKASSYRIPEGNPLRIIVRSEDSEQNPEDLYRIIRLEQEKKARRYKWMDISYSLIGTDDAEGSGYIPFAASKYGEKSYLLEIPAEMLQAGEYAIVFVHPTTATSLGVVTFGIE